MKTTKEINLVNELLKENSPRAMLGILKRNHIELFNKINNINISGFFSEKLYLFIHSMTEKPLCPNCNKNRINKFFSFSEGYGKGCSKKCGSIISMKERVMKYNLEHDTNFTNSSQFPEVRKKLNEKMQVRDFKNVTKTYKKNMMEKYGVSNSFMVDEVKLKIKETCLLKYGVENPMKNKEIAAKCTNNAKETMLKKYGVKYGSQISDFKEKSKKTFLKNYGVDHFMKDKDLCNKNHLKMKKTILKRYNVEYILQSPTFLEKQIKSCELKKFKRKEYIWKTGEISLVQGYEPIVLKELEEQGYKFEEVLTSPKDMPKIMYQLDEKEHRYYPDIFIPKDNIIIEVKSDYTLNKEWDKNQAKFEAAKSLGFDFRLEVR